MKKNTFCVKNKFNLAETKSTKNIRLGDQLVIIKYFDNFNF